jgi:hypothetical protein
MWVIESFAGWLQETFGWCKPVGRLTQLKLRGLPKVKAKFKLALAAYDPVRTPMLLHAIALAAY